MKRKKLGIMGGMGPAATVYLYNRILELTRATNDQDHLEIIIHSNPDTPDRTKAILHNGSSPLPELLRSALLLENAGVDYILISCMTAHFYYTELSKLIKTDIINAMDETSRYLLSLNKGMHSVGILGTTGTIQSGLFQSSLIKCNIRSIIVPEQMQEELVMRSIYGHEGIKSGFVTQEIKGSLLSACNYLIYEGVDAIIAGCTEIPLAISQKDLEIPFIDPMEVIARVAIERCR